MAFDFLFDSCRLKNVWFKRRQTNNLGPDSIFVQVLAKLVSARPLVIPQRHNLRIKLFDNVKKIVALTQHRFVHKLQRPHHAQTGFFIHYRNRALEKQDILVPSHYNHQFLSHFFGTRQIKQVTRMHQIKGSKRQNPTQHWFFCRFGFFHYKIMHKTINNVQDTYFLSIHHK